MKKIKISPKDAIDVLCAIGCYTEQLAEDEQTEQNIKLREDLKRISEEISDQLLDFPELFII